MSLPHDVSHPLCVGTLHGPCPVLTDQTILFRFRLGGNGQVRQGYLGEANTYNGVRIPIGTLIRFDNPFSIGPMLFAQGAVEHKDRQYEAGLMRIQGDGGVVWGRLEHPAKINGQTYPAGTALTFKASGKFVNAEFP